MKQFQGYNSTCSFILGVKYISLFLCSLFVSLMSLLPSARVYYSHLCSNAAGCSSAWYDILHIEYTCLYLPYRQSSVLVLGRGSFRCFNLKWWNGSSVLSFIPVPGKFVITVGPLRFACSDPVHHSVQLMFPSPPPIIRGHCKSGVYTV